MRILHMFWALGNGGIENMMVEIANRQSISNDVALLVINNKVDELLRSRISPNCNLFMIGRKASSGNPWPIMKLNFIIMKFRPQIIHFHSFGMIRCVFYPFAIKVRTIHNTRNECSEYPKYKKLFSISKAVYDYTAKQGYSSVIINNGIKVDAVKHHSQPVALENNTWHFVQVSRLEKKQKGQDLLLMALASLKKKGFTNFVMHFIGDGPSAADLKEMTINLGLSDNVIFEGNRSQDYVYNNLCNYSLFIQPSRFEGFGLTVAEALAAKIPILVSDIEGPLEIIEKGKYGLTFKTGDADDLTSQLERIMTEGVDYAQVEAAYRHVCQNYDIKKTYASYDEEYRKLI